MVSSAGEVPEEILLRAEMKKGEPEEKHFS